MIEIKNPNFVPRIEKKTINFIQCDYELHLADLQNMKVIYDKTKRQLIVQFDPIYVYDLEKLTRIDRIFYNYSEISKLNGFYEIMEHKPHLITIGEDINKTLNEILQSYYKGNIKLETL